MCDNPPVISLSSKAVWKKVVWCAISLLSVVVVSTNSQAASFSARERAAKKACLSGDYEKGISILTDLFIDTNDTTYIFNQGRCYEQSGKYEEAIIRFREYLSKKLDAGAKGDANAERHIANCEAFLAKERRQAAQAAPVAPANPRSAESTSTQQQNTEAPATASAAEPAVATAAPLAAAEAPAVMAPPEAGLEEAASPSRPGAALRIGGIVGIGVGVAGIAGGVLLALKANSLASNLESAPTSYSRSMESTRSSYATWSAVSYGVGAACIAGGAVAYYLGWRKARSASVALQPSLTASTAGAVVQGAF